MNCLWNLGTACAGSINERLIFNAQLNVPMCDRHYNEHLIITLLIGKGVKQSEINEFTAEQRNEMLAKLLNGEDLNAAIKNAGEVDSKKNDE